MCVLTEVVRTGRHALTITQSQPKLSRSVADLFDSHDDRDDDGEAGSVEEGRSGNISSVLSSLLGETVL